MKGLFKYLIACLYLHSSVNIYAQYEAATWYFGDNSVLKFTTTSAHFFIRNHYLNKGIAMASNCNGEEVITGEDFGGTYLNGGFSQQQILISDPASSNQYYFFYTDNFSDTAYLKYKHVHINSGALTTLGSGNLLFRFAGKLAAVKHQNNNDFWLVTHTFYSNSFYSYLITSNGIQPPVISNTGIFYGSAWNDFTGNLKISPDGSKITVSNTKAGILELFDFNSATGVVSNQIQIKNNTVTSVLGIEFSPTGKYLYASSSVNPKLFQFDISNHQVSSIISSANLIDSLSSGYFGSLQNGLDGKIYCSIAVSQYIAVIENPDSNYNSINYSRNALSLAGGTCLEGFPNLVSSYFKPKAKKISTRNFCEGNETQFSFTPYSETSNVQWFFNDSGNAASSTAYNPSHIFSDSGLYHISLITEYACGIDTLSSDIYISAVPEIELGDDTTFCAGDSVVLSDKFLNSTYLYDWNNGDTSSFLAVTTSGIYVLNKSNNLCTAADSISITVKPNSPINTVNDTIVCPYLNDQAELSSLKDSYNVWNNGINGQSSIVVNVAGTYSVISTNQFNCSRVQSWMVSENCTQTFYLPSAFTPNNDGVNDYWQAVFTGIPQIELVLYNRWGQKVYETDSPAFKWNGEFQNKTVSNGMYFYVVKVTRNKQTEVFKNSLCVLK